MEPIGFAKLYRSLLNWEWYSDNDMLKLFIHLILTVNWKAGKWRGKLIKPGQRIISLAKLSEETNISIRTIRTCLKRLKSTHEVTQESTSHYTLITLTKFKDYQSLERVSDTPSDTPSDTQVTNKRHASDMQVTTIEEVKKVRSKECKKLRSKDIKIEDEITAIEILALGEFEKVIMTPFEYQRLIDKYDKGKIDKYIEKLDLYIKSNGFEKKYKSHCATVMAWIRKDEDEQEKIKSDGENPFLKIAREEEINEQKRNGNNSDGTDNGISENL